MITSVHFHLRRSMRGEGYPGSLYARITRGRRSAKVTLPLQLYAREWDSQRHEIVFTPGREWRFEKLRWTAGELERTGRLFRLVIDRLEMSGCCFSVREVINGYRLSRGGYLLGDLVKDLRDNLIKNDRIRTTEAYMTTFRKLSAFFGANERIMTVKEKEIELRHLTPSFIRSFEQSLWKENLMANTVSFYMRNLRAIYNKGVEQGFLEPPLSNPFAGVYTGIPVTVKRALSKKEMKRMIEKTLPLPLGGSVKSPVKNVSHRPGYPIEDKTLMLSSGDGSRAALFFLFSFYARGMSFVDVAYLRKDNIRGNVLRYSRRKTGRWLEMKLTDEMKGIIRSFEKETHNSPYVFPIIRCPGENERRQYLSALRRQNKCLKGLAEQLTTHVARHTWASIGKEENLPLSVISEGLGHSSLKTTSIYLASFDRVVLDRANARIHRAVRHTVA